MDGHTHTHTFKRRLLSVSRSLLCRRGKTTSSRRHARQCSVENCETSGSKRGRGESWLTCSDHNLFNEGVGWGWGAHGGGGKRDMKDDVAVKECRVGKGGCETQRAHMHLGSGMSLHLQTNEVSGPQRVRTVQQRVP